MRMCWQGWFLAVVTVFSLCYAPNAARAQVTKRPLSGFLQAQGTTATVFAPVPDYLFFFDAVGTSGSVDYAGIANQFLVNHGLPSLGTKIDGSVSERTLSNGLAEVTVILHTSNALTFVTDPNNIPLFGYLATELPANPSLRPAIGDSLFKVVFKNTAGAPIPDLDCLTGIVPCPANFELRFISLYATATGPLRSTSGVPENTPGRATIVQTGLFGLPVLPPKSRVTVNGGFPAEIVALQVVGK